MKQLFKKIFYCSLLLTPNVALSNPICDDLWFSRNFYFDRAGYCFSSVLGEEVFDNTNCTTNDPELSIFEKAIISDIQAQEHRLGCNIKIDQRRDLDLEWPKIRRQLIDQPMRVEFESACIGYRKPNLSLFAGREDTSLEIGQIETGDTILFYHATPKPGPKRQTFISGVIREDLSIPIIGWTNTVLREEDCEDIAG